MEQGGIMYWSELYPGIGLIDDYDERNIFIPEGIKYKLLDIIRNKLEDLIGSRISVWEEYDLIASDLPRFLDILEEVDTPEKELSDWIDKAKIFLLRAISFKKDISIAL